MTVQWNLNLYRNAGNGNEWPLRYPPYSTIVNSIYVERVSYSFVFITKKEN
jgi:hypothetical protein